MQTFQGYDALLQASPVFYDIAPEEIHAMLDCLSAKTLSYPKGSFLFHYGDHLDSLGLVLEGCVDVMKEDFWGNTNLMTRCRPGDIFGESYAQGNNVFHLLNSFHHGLPPLLLNNLFNMIAFFSPIIHQN